MDCIRTIKVKVLLSYIEFEPGGKAWRRLLEKGLGATAAATGAGAPQRGAHRIACMTRIEPYRVVNGGSYTTYWIAYAPSKPKCH